MNEQIFNWLYQTSVEITILIALVLLLRPVVRKTLGANVAYWLWLLPLVRVLLPERPTRGGTVLEAVGLSNQNLAIEFIPTPSLAIDVLQNEIAWGWIWVGGVIAWITLRLIIWVRFRQAILASSTPVSLPLDLINAVTEKIQWLPAQRQFLTCVSPSAPFVTGVLRPKIYLPQDFHRRFNIEEQAWVIVHELTHIRRWDLWVQFLGECFRTLFWFNPVVHFAVLVVQEDQELACDYTVLSRCSEQDRYQYGRALMSGVGPQLVPSIMTFFGKGKERFTMLSKHKLSKFNTILGVSLCAAISLFALTKAPGTLANGQYVKDDPITMEFSDIPLGQAIEMFANFNQFAVFNMDIVDPEIKVLINVANEPANEVFNEILQCAGLEFIEYESGIELQKVSNTGNAAVKYCVITKNMHWLIEGSEVKILDNKGNVLRSPDSKVTKFR